MSSAGSRLAVYLCCSVCQTNDLSQCLRLTVDTDVNVGGRQNSLIFPVSFFIPHTDMQETTLDGLSLICQRFMCSSDCQFRQFKNPTHSPTGFVWDLCHVVTVMVTSTFH